MVQHAFICAYNIITNVRSVICFSFLQAQTNTNDDLIALSIMSDHNLLNF